MKILWVYAYQIVPPQPSNRLGTIRTLLEDATVAARGEERSWSGRLVLERRITHILIVSDDPGQNDEINHRLEAELARLHAPFSMTEPLAVAGNADGRQGAATSNGNGRH
jgi:hypothetical protein